MKWGAFLSEVLTVQVLRVARHPISSRSIPWSGVRGSNALL